MAKRRPSGDGMVRKREDGRWEGRIVVGHKDNGDSIFRYVYADTQKELTARLRKCITAYQGVDLTEQSRLTLSEWLDQWLVSKEGMVRPGTLNGYRGYIENHIRPCLGEKRIGQLKAADIQRFYDMLSRKLASGTVRRIHTTLHGILKAAAQARLIPRNPVEEVTPPKFSYQEKKVLTAEQVDRLLEFIQKDTLWHDLFYTELTTGPAEGRAVRPAVGGLRRSEWNLENLPHGAPGEGQGPYHRRYQDLRGDTDDHPAAQPCGAAEGEKAGGEDSLDIPGPAPPGAADRTGCRLPAHEAAAGAGGTA